MHVSQLTIDVRLDADDRKCRLREDARRGLTSVPKDLPPKWHYDERGSQLFVEITRLPEYYLTRVETEILERVASEVALLSEADTIVELGSGSSEKTRILLDAFDAKGRLERFVPFDVSEAALHEAAARIAADYPGVTVHALVGDFEHELELLPPGGRRLAAFLGSSYGNLRPAERADLLDSLRRTLGLGDTLLLGTDLVKERETLERAYDDPAGVTAQFNLNVLRVLNRELGAEFDTDRFEYVARWNPDEEWMEMYLRSTTEQRVHVAELGQSFRFAPGELMRIETSAKFRRERVERELANAGFRLVSWWEDADGRFALSLAAAAAAPESLDGDGGI